MCIKDLLYRIYRSKQGRVCLFGDLVMRKPKLQHVDSESTAEGPLGDAFQTANPEDNERENCDAHPISPSPTAANERHTFGTTLFEGSTRHLVSTFSMTRDSTPNCLPPACDISGSSRT